MTNRMREGIRKRISLLRFELDESWPSFSLTSLISIILIVYSLLLLNSFASIRTGFGPGSTSNLPRVENFLNTMNRVAVNAMGTSTAIMNFLLVSIIPLVCSFTFASSFENRILRNLLSLPITRNSVLFTKVMIMFSILALPSVLGLLLGTYWFIPNSLSLTVYILLGISLLLGVLLNISIAMLVAIQTRSLIKGTFLSLAICYLLFLASSANLVPVQILGIINPIHSTNIYLGVSPTVPVVRLGLDLLLLSMEGCFIFALFLLVISVAKFNNVEVE